MAAELGSPTKLQANAVPFPSPPPRDAPQPAPNCTSLPRQRVQSSNVLCEEGEPSGPPRSQRATKRDAGHRGRNKCRPLAPAPLQPTYSPNALGIVFPSPATPSPSLPPSPFRFPPSEHPLPPKFGSHHHPHFHPSPGLHHYHSYPSLPKLGGHFTPPPTIFTTSQPPLFPPPPSTYSGPSPAFIQIAAPYPISPPHSLRHQHSFSYSSSTASQPFDVPSAPDLSPINSMHPSLPSSPPFLALSPQDQQIRAASAPTCDVWDCFALAACEISPCSCMLCHKHLRMVIHGAQVVDPSRSKGGVRATTLTSSAEAALEQRRKLFQCSACRTQSQALRQVDEESEGGRDDFDIGDFGVRDLAAVASESSTSSSSSPPIAAPSKVTLPLTIAVPLFPTSPITELGAGGARQRCLSSPPTFGPLPCAEPTVPTESSVVERVVLPPDYRNSIGGHGAPSSASRGLTREQQLKSGQDDATGADEPTLLKLDNIPWSVTVADVEQWLPAECRPRTTGPAPSIHLVLHRNSARTLPRCFIENLSAEAISQAIAQRQNHTMLGRTIRLSPASPDELLHALFSQGDYWKPGPSFPTSPSGCRPSLPSRDELQRLIACCALRPPKDHHVSYPAERPFQNVLQLISKFPWSDTSIYSPGDVDNLFECTSQAISIAMSNSDVEASYHTLAQQLKRIVVDHPVFTNIQKARICIIYPSRPYGSSAQTTAIRHHKSFPSLPAHQRPRTSSTPSSNGSAGPQQLAARQRRGSLLGPAGEARLLAVPRELTSLSTYQRHDLPASPPESPATSNERMLGPGGTGVPAPS